MCTMYVCVCVGEMKNISKPARPRHYISASLIGMIEARKEEKEAGVCILSFDD